MIAFRIVVHTSYVFVYHKNKKNCLFKNAPSRYDNVTYL